MPHFLSKVLVVNIKSASSPIRLCINPAVRHRALPPSSGKLAVPPAKLTFNDTIYQYGGSLITPEILYLHQTVPVQLSAADIKVAFRQIALAPDTQFRCLVHRLKNKAGCHPRP